MGRRWLSPMSSRTARQTLAAAGVITSLVFVGMQIRESNIQARAAAYREIGISTAEFHRGFNARMNRLATESAYPEAVKRWTLEDWETMDIHRRPSHAGDDPTSGRAGPAPPRRCDSARIQLGSDLEQPRYGMPLARATNASRIVSPQVHRRFHARGR